MVFPFLNMVPDKLVLQPGGLLLSKLRVANALILEGKPLSAFVADNGLHVAIGRGLRHIPQPSCNTGSHHRGSRRCRGPRSPRPPSRNPPRCVWGLASLTVSARPPDSLPFNAAMAFSASSSFVIETKPNPRDRPVSRSVARLALSTVP